MEHDLQSVLEQAASAGLRLVATETRIDDSGADFLVARGPDEAGAHWIVRVPRRPDVMARAAVESQALQLLRQRLPVAVPDWRIATHDLIAYPRLPGQPAATIDMSAGGYVWCFDQAAPPREFVDSFTAALAALHRIEPVLAGAAGIPIRSPEEVRREHAERMGKAEELLDLPARLRVRWRRWLAEDAFWPPHSTLIHGDLHPAHILVDDQRRVIGLLDWTETQVGDPTTDFTLQYASMGPAALDALLDGYERAGGVRWSRMREHVIESWLAYPSTVATFALLTGDAAHLDFAQMLATQADRFIGEHG